MPLFRNTSLALIFLTLLPFIASATTSNTSNVIDRTGTPKQHKEYDKYQNQRFNPLFDLGAWHGFLLPEKQNKTPTPPLLAR
jgi:putative isomerase